MLSDIYYNKDIFMQKKAIKCSVVPYFNNIFQYFYFISFFIVFVLVYLYNHLNIQICKIYFLILDIL